MIFMCLATLCGVRVGFGVEQTEAGAGTALKDAEPRLDFFEWPRLVAISPEAAAATV